MTKLRKYRFRKIDENISSEFKINTNLLITAENII